jgi:hypothetical protein
LDGAIWHGLRDFGLANLSMHDCLAAFAKGTQIAVTGGSRQKIHHPKRWRTGGAATHAIEGARWTGAFAARIACRDEVPNRRTLKQDRPHSVDRLKALLSPMMYGVLVYTETAREFIDAVAAMLLDPIGIDATCGHFGQT